MGVFEHVELLLMFAQVSKLIVIFVSKYVDRILNVRVFVIALVVSKMI